MAVFNAAKREIDLKIVYYGPAMCGKTTNVQCIHKMLAPQQRGELMSLATKDDRTLFFDFLPIELAMSEGLRPASIFIPFRGRCIMLSPGAPC